MNPNARLYICPKCNKNYMNSIDYERDRQTRFYRSLDEYYECDVNDFYEKLFCHCGCVIYQVVDQSEY